MFKAMFEKETRYFQVWTTGRPYQLFASVASMLRWYSNIGVTDTDQIIRIVAVS